MPLALTSDNALLSLLVSSSDDDDDEEEEELLDDDEELLERRFFFLPFLDFDLDLLFFFSFFPISPFNRFI